MTRLLQPHAQSKEPIAEYKWKASTALGLICQVHSPADGLVRKAAKDPRSIIRLSVDCMAQDEVCLGPCAFRTVRALTDDWKDKPEAQYACDVGITKAILRLLKDDQLPQSQEEGDTPMEQAMMDRARPNINDMVDAMRTGLLTLVLDVDSGKLSDAVKDGLVEEVSGMLKSTNTKTVASALGAVQAMVPFREAVQRLYIVGCIPSALVRALAAQSSITVRDAAKAIHAVCEQYPRYVADFVDAGAPSKLRSLISRCKTPALKATMEQALEHMKNSNGSALGGSEVAGALEGPQAVVASGRSVFKFDAAVSGKKPSVRLLP